MYFFLIRRLSLEHLTNLTLDGASALFLLIDEFPSPTFLYDFFICLCGLLGFSTQPSYKLGYCMVNMITVHGKWPKMVNLLGEKVMIYLLKGFGLMVHIFRYFPTGIKWFLLFQKICFLPSSGEKSSILRDNANSTFNQNMLSESIRVLNVMTREKNYSCEKNHILNMKPYAIHVEKTHELKMI